MVYGRLWCVCKFLGFLALSLAGKCVIRVFLDELHVGAEHVIALHYLGQRSLWAVHVLDDASGVS